MKHPFRMEPVFCADEKPIWLHAEAWPILCDEAASSVRLQVSSALGFTPPVNGVDRAKREYFGLTLVTVGCGAAFGASSTTARSMCIPVPAN